MFHVKQMVNDLKRPNKAVFRCGDIVGVIKIAFKNFVSYETL